MTHTTENSKEVLAEEIANKWSLDDGDLLHDAAIEAMKEFSSLQNRQLLDSNRELLEALELAKEIMDTYKISNSKAGVRMIAAINNAKNLL